MDRDREAIEHGISLFKIGTCLWLGEETDLTCQTGGIGMVFKGQTPQSNWL